MFDTEDPDLEPIDDFDSPIDSGAASGQGTPSQTAAEGEADASQSLTPDAEQPNAPQEETTPHDEAFKSETVVKDYKSWQLLNQTIAEFTGKEPDEIKAMPFVERMQLLANERTALTDKLDKLAEFETFVGIKVDAPAEKWDVAPQIESLPENHKNKLIHTVFRDHLPTLVETALSDPETYKDEYALIDQTYTNLLEQQAGRPWQEVRDILSITQGLSAQQLYQHLQQGAGNGQTTQQPVAQTGAPQSTSAYILSQATAARQEAQNLVNAGYETDSAEVQSWLRQEQSMRYAAQQAASQEREQAQLQQRIGGIEDRLSKAGETEAQKSAQRIDGEYEQAATAARNGALDAVVKGRVSEDLMPDVRELIDARAERLISSNAKAQTALALAKDFEKDGLAVKAKGQMAFYTAIVSRAYKEAGSFVLTKFVVPAAKSLQAADRQKAARKEIGLTGGARANVTTANPLNGRRNMRDEDVGEAAFELYQARNS